MKSHEYIVKINENGKATGYDAEKLEDDLRNHFRGSFARITIEAYTPTPDRMNKWYWGVILPTALRCMKATSHPVDPASTADRKWLHEQYKKMFLIPTQRRRGNKTELYYTTTNLGMREWWEYTTKIVDMIYDEYGVLVRADPQKRRQ